MSHSHPCQWAERGLWEASPLCDWNKAVVCHTDLKEISLKNTFFTPPAPWQADKMIQTLSLETQQCTLLKAHWRETWAKMQLYRIKPVIVLCDCTLRFTTNTLLFSVFLSLHPSLSLLSHTHIGGLLYPFVLCPIRAPVLQECGVGGISTRPLCSFPLCQNRDVQNCS